MQKPLLTSFCLLALVVFLATGKACASHAAGGEILYEWLGDSTYKVVFKFYRDCRGASEPYSATLCYRNTCTNQVYQSMMDKAVVLPDGVPNGSPVSTGCSGYQNSCLSAGSTLPGYAEWWYIDTVTLPAKCSSWKFYTFVSQRNPSSNIETAVFYAEAMLNNEVAQDNNSPYFSIKPVPYVCINQQYTFNNGAVDVDKDSLVFEVMTPQQITGNSCSFLPINCVLKGKVPPLALPSNPFQTDNTFKLDATTGALSFTPSEGGPQTVTIQAKEYRDGVLIGSVMRDIQVQVLYCDNVPPVVDPLIPSFVNAAWVNNRVEACASAPFSFCFAVKSGDQSIVLKATDNHQASIPGASITYSNQLTDSITGCFSWTPSILDTGLKLLIVTVVDTTCVPPGILFSQSFTLPIYIWPGTRPAPTVFFDLPDEACLGQQLVVEADRKGLLHYAWTTAPAVVVEGAGDRYTLKWDNPGTYFVSLATIHSVVSGCISWPYTDTIHIRDHPHAEILSISNDKPCIGDTVSVKGVDVATYNYYWSPAEDLAQSRRAEAVVKVKDNIKLVMTVKDDLGCEASDSISVRGLPCCTVSLPSAFTPNQDGKNDLFRAINASHSKVETFIIMNRFGEIVFRTTNIHKGWDGTFAGVPLDVGTYFYYLKYKCIDNAVYEKKGDVVLIR